MISFGALALGLIIVVSVTAMLLRRQLREKYAVLWLAIGLAALLLGIFPAALQWLTIALGFQLPANLIFTLAIALLLAVSLHLSWELTRSEERLRRLAEEAAIARLAQDRLEADVAELRALVVDRPQSRDDE
ncbi:MULTISPECIES: DUF2304 domain-containing protein [Microbacterium]|uniref:DUF2304 domain-containing protein n=1 Tax=Microbacterium TaxID=33882 RepID=UPI0011ED1552|nr:MULTISPECIES: DUF2304 domain-containing protein [Microbacterium]KAA0961395.1 DUF2304 domain-containing protein [Microbacterium sp. ANT_H45B]CAH0130431.1 hypothetical protein SRABI03_00260 [Microbacterium foliorum]CAH0168355.1 hypothetical protein SRABI44_01141 [Microbacterium foliorum]